MTVDAWWSLLAVLVMIIGLFGVLIPVLPGLLLIWATALVYGFIVGFGALGIGVMVVLTVLVAVSIVTGITLPKKEAEASGASGLSQLAGLAGGVVGFFVIPVVGLIIGALAGVALAEFLAKGNWPEAWTATKGVAKGFGLSAAVDFGLGMLMIGAWSVWAAVVIL